MKARNAEEGDNAGSALALSADGSTLAVGAFTEASLSAGVNGNEADNSAPTAGAVYVFRKNGSAWSQAAYLKASNPSQEAFFGLALSLSGDGSTLAVGASGEHSAATGVNGNQTDNTSPRAGAVYIFAIRASSWSQQAYLKASNAAADDEFGASLSLSSDGNTLAVGAPGESSSATGINGNQNDNGASRSGAVYAFHRVSDAWSQEAYIKASNCGAEDEFGSAVALSADAGTLAIAARNERSSATGIQGNQADNRSVGSGAVYTFLRSSGSVWSQEAYIKASNTSIDSLFGRALALSADGRVLAVGAARESSDATGVGGDQDSNGASRSGAAYIFRKTATVWAQEAYLKASNTGAQDHFGSAIALSADGSVAAVGAPYESSNANGVNGDQTNDSRASSGAVYLFRRSGVGWAQEAYVKAGNSAENMNFGYDLALSANGGLLAVGAPGAANSTGAVSLLHP